MDLRQRLDLHPLRACPQGNTGKHCTSLTPKLQACWRAATGSAPANMQPTWSTVRFAHVAASTTEAHRLWEFKGCSTLDLPLVFPVARMLGDAETGPALWIRGLVPARFLHEFPIPDNTALFGCEEAATSDIISPRHGERMLVGFGDAGRP